MRRHQEVLFIFKKAILLILGAVVIGGLILFLCNNFFQLNPFGSSSESISPNTNNEEKPNEDDSDSMNRLEDIILSGTQGSIPQLQVRAGQTNITEIHEQYGEADKRKSISRGVYLTYEKEHFSVGYGNDGTIFDIRSFAPGLEEIHYETIKQKLGNPDHVRYYQDDNFDQIILVYDLNKTYQLKFILPKPTDSQPNPSLHHTSVLKISVKETGDEPVTINDQINEMTLNEKIGQMIFAGFSGSELSPQLKNLIQQNKVGGLIFYRENMTSPQQTVQLINMIKEENINNPLPLLFGVDQEGGRISRLPGPLDDIPTNQQIGKQNDVDYSYEIGKLLGKEVKSYGFNLDFAPVLDINSNPNNPVIGDRSFGNQPSIVSKLGIQVMKGIRAENVIPVIKHFPGHGDTDVDSHLELPKVDKSLGQLNEMELIPFKNAIKNNADVVMIAHILLSKIDPENPASLSKTIITDLLREKLNYHGIVITDDMTMDAIEKNFDLESAAVKSIVAGSDIIMVAHNEQKTVAVHEAIKKAVMNGTLSEQRVNESVERIIKMKKKYKINAQNQVPYVDVNKLNQEISHVIK